MQDQPDGTPSDLAERVLGLVAGRAEAVVRASAGTSSLTRFANSRIHQNVTEDVISVHLTVALDGGRVARVSGNRADDEALSGLVERALAAAALRPPDPEFPGFAPPAPVTDPGHWDDATAGATPHQRAAVVADFVAAGSAGPADDSPGGGPAGGGSGGGGSGGGMEAAGFCATRAAHHVLLSSTGQRAAFRSSSAEVDGIFRAATSGRPADGAAQTVSTRLADVDGAACGARAAAKARAGRDPRSLPPGAYEVVLEPRAVAAALLFPAYLGFNGKGHAEGTSFVHLGEQQWDASVDLWDDATDPRALGGAYDPEGTPKRRLDLVSAGVSTGLAHDRRSARAAGAEPTGHSVGSDAEGGFPTDLFLGGGEASPEALIGSVERGLLVADLWYNRVLDPKSQVVTGLTRNGLFLVEEGAVVGAVENMRYTQSIVAAFGPGKVGGLGDDARLAGGEGWVVHVPTVRLVGWTFTGNAQG